MTVRRAGPEDLAQLMDWAQAFLRFHPLTAALPHDLDALQAALAQMLARADAVILTNGRGVIGGVAAPVWCCPGTRMATELFWWAEGGGLDLMRAFERWAIEEQGADLVQMLAIVGRRVEDLARVYHRAGYAPVEIAFVRPVGLER